MGLELVEWVEEQLTTQEVDDAVALLVLSALEGERQLDEYLEAVESETVEPRRNQDPNRARTREASAGVVLKSLRVAGFRGIGPECGIEFHPAPGLTVVAGRNGSGKSSLAEAFEVLLTGDTYRWSQKRSKEWADQWRNIHHTGPVVVAAEVVSEGPGATTLRTEWAADCTDLGGRTSTIQGTVDGKLGPRQSADVLGWAQPLETYRPMLSYDELGGLLEEGPSRLYDALAKLLGMERMTEAIALVDTRAKRAKAPATDLTKARKVLAARAGELDDERAASVATHLHRTRPDTEKLRAITTGVDVPDSGVIAGLRALVGLVAPSSEEVGRVASRLRSAVQTMADAGESDSRRRLARHELRQSALRLHEEHGEQSCPVCSQGTLDEGWLTTSRELVAKEGAALQELKDAASELEAARAAVSRCAAGCPPSLDRSPTPTLDASVTALKAAWTKFAGLPDGDLACAEHLEKHHQELNLLACRLREEASAELAGRDDAWGPMAAEISAWTSRWDAWLEQKPKADLLTRTAKWLNANDTRLKNERLRPVSEQARAAWATLRQESNVELGELRLAGTKNRRKVAIGARVDGEETSGALPIMSQGELHALTLALFLPRASMDESPFRFVILDDPVQAMDPAKIDGLVTLLLDLARTRQIIVFSHDDRLPAALRRSGAEARILEVARAERSVVTVGSSQDPAGRYLSDAYALTRDEAVTADALSRTLPGLLRMAVESAAQERFYGMRLSQGASLHDVDWEWNDAHTTGQRVSLAVHGEIRSLDHWLRTEGRRRGLGIVSRGFHEGLGATRPDDAVRFCTTLVDDIRQSAR